MSATYTRSEVAQHATPDSNWIIVDDKVYDVTKFAMFHPGGRAFIDKVAGSDATKQFYAFHRQDVLRSHGSKYLIGTLADAPSKRDATVALAPGELSAVPYAESGAFQGLPSPYYDDSHRRFRRDLRHFFDEKVVPDAVANDAAGKPPPLDLWREMGTRGMLASRVQPGPWLRDIVDNCGVTLPGGISPEEFDSFHELIAHEEFCRLGVPGYCDGLGAGFVIGLPPILQFASPDVSRRVGREILCGEKRVALAISGPEAGSDVAGLDCVARRTPLLRVAAATKKTAVAMFRLPRATHRHPTNDASAKSDSVYATPWNTLAGLNAYSSAAARASAASPTTARPRCSSVAAPRTCARFEIISALVARPQREGSLSPPPPRRVARSTKRIAIGYAGKNARFCSCAYPRAAISR